MGIEFWLIPLIAILAVSVGAFFLVIRLKGGSGVRNEGRTLLDEPVNKEAPKTGWNFYAKP